MWVIASTIAGIVAAAIASNKGRSVVGWFFGGFFLGLIGIIIIAVLPNLKAKAAEEHRTEIERRRLREQLRQERLKNEAFRQHTANRLDAHDQGLGMDTRRQQPIQLQQHEPLGRLPQQPTGASGGANQPAPISAGGNGSRMWHYELGGQAVGPVSEQVVRKMLLDGQLSGNALLWTEGMEDWAQANQISSFKMLAGS